MWDQLNDLSAWSSTSFPFFWEPADERVNDRLSFIVESDESYVFTPPSGGPTKKRLIAVAASALWYEDL